MSLPTDLDAALRRLSAALGQLEAAAERRAAADAARGDQDEEFAILQDDRSRLAVELDGALALARGLESAHAEVLRRIERADAAIRTLIAEPAPAPAPPPSGSTEI
jgi:hypothetical protein